MEKEPTAAALPDTREMGKKDREREGEMNLGSELGSRESVLSESSKTTNKRRAQVGASAPQRPRDPRKQRENNSNRKPTNY